MLISVPTKPEWSWLTNRNAHCIGLSQVNLHQRDGQVHLDGVSAAGRHLTGGIWIEESAWNELMERCRKPIYTIKVEEEVGGDDYNRFYVMLYSPDGQNSACIQESVFTTDEMDGIMFDDFIKEAEAAAVTWDANLDIQVNKADYFEEESKDE